MSFRRLAAIVGHEVRIARRDALPILVLVVFPIITIAFLKPAFRPALVQAGYAHANGAEQVVPGQATVSAFFVVSLVTFAFFSEYAWATFERLRASPATSIEIVLGKAIPRVGMAIVEYLIVFAAGLTFFHLHIRGDGLALIPLVTTFSICLVLLGVAVTALCRTAQQANAFAVVGMVLFGAIGGALVPSNVLPGWAGIVAPSTPTYWAMRGFRSVIVDGQGMASVLTPVAVLLAMAAAFGLIAACRLRFDEAKVGWS